MEAEVSFGAWLQRRRKALDLTQEALAQRAACSVATIRKIEGDERRPSREVAELLARVLEIPAAEQERFLRVARGELRVERLQTVSALLPSLAAVAPLPAIPAAAPAALPAPASTPSVSPPKVTPPSLPTPATPLIGRTAEVAEACQLLARADCRLLTMVGPGGIGKTRLALAVATTLADAFPDGAAFVALTPLLAPEFMVQAIAGAIDFTFSTVSEPKQQLLHYLRSKTMLLVLDNIEHLLAPAQPAAMALNADADACVTLLVDLIQQAPQVKLIVTSRERLHLQGEWICELQGLPLPTAPAAGSGMLNEAAYAAVALFVHHARCAQLDFALTVQNQPEIVRICRLVEGMPLGIELAAAWTPMLSCREIAEEIERNIDFLAMSRRDVPPRHRSLRATFDHSWNLLTQAEQRVLRQLAVFAGGFTREAASAVAGGALPVLAALVGKSLLRRSVTDRYDLHEFIRQYAAELLATDPAEQQATQERHTRYYAAKVESWTQPLMSARHHETAKAIKAEIDNIRLAWSRAVATHQWAELRRMAEGLAWFYETQCTFAEGEATFRHAVEQLRGASLLASASADRLAYLITLQGWFSFRTGKISAALPLLQEALPLLRAGADPPALFYTLAHHLFVAMVLGNYREAEALCDEAVAVAHRTGRAWYLALALTELGMIRLAQGQPSAAYPILHDSLRAWRAEGDPRGLTFCCDYLSLAAESVGQVAEALALTREVLACTRDSDDRWGAGTALNRMGLLVQRQGDRGQAEQLFAESYATFQAIGNQWGMALAAVYTGNARLSVHDTDAARRHFVHGLQLALAAQVPPVALDALIGLAAVALKTAAFAAAYDLLLVVNAHPALTPVSKAQADALCAQATAHLTPDEVAAAQARVAAKRFDDVVVELLPQGE